MERVRWLRVIVTMATITACITYVHLSSTEQHSVVHPSLVSHGSPQVGTSSIRTITISPQSGVESSDVVQSITEQVGGCPDFNIQLLAPLPATVSSTCASGSGSDIGTGSDIGSDTGSGSGSGSGGCDAFSVVVYSFQTVFTPKQTGTQSCTLNLLVSGQSSTITLSGTGVPPPIDIELESGANANNTSRCEPNCVAPFGATNVGLQATPKFVKVVNTGSANTALITSVTITPDAGPFVILTGDVSDVPLVSGGSETYSITCEPQAQFAPLTRTLTVTTNDPAQAVHTVTLSCEGVDSDLAADSLNVFTRVHETVLTNGGAHPPLTLTNVGTATLTINNITFDPPSLADDFTNITGVSAGTTIAPNATRTVVFTYTPRLPVADPIGTITFTYDTNKTREVVITGPVVDTTLSLSPTGPSGLANLGVACVGSTNAQTFTLTANNDGDFDLRGISIVVPDPPIYAVVPRTPATLPTMASPAKLIANSTNKVEFDITFTPAEPVLSPNLFTIATDIPSASGPQSFGVSLMGTGLPLGQNVTPGPLDFGTVVTGEIGETRTVEFTHCATDALTITRAEIVGDQDFQIITPPASLDVAANATVAFEIALAPEFGGAKRATLELEHANGISSVVLIGNGDGPLPPTDTPLDRRESYYACSTGDAGSSLPVWIAIGMLVVVRRRRSR